VGSIPNYITGSWTTSGQTGTLAAGSLADSATSGPYNYPALINSEQTLKMEGFRVGAECWGSFVMIGVINGDSLFTDPGTPSRLSINWDTLLPLYQADDCGAGSTEQITGGCSDGSGEGDPNDPGSGGGEGGYCVYRVALDQFNNIIAVLYLEYCV
jgi:hypothetical protein